MSSYFNITITFFHLSLIKSIQHRVTNYVNMIISLLMHIAKGAIIPVERRRKVSSCSSWNDCDVNDIAFIDFDKHLAEVVLRLKFSAGGNVLHCRLRIFYFEL